MSQNPPVQQTLPKNDSIHVKLVMLNLTHNVELALLCVHSTEVFSLFLVG